MASADKQNALKDAMERAKQIAAKLQQQKQTVGGSGDAPAAPAQASSKPYVSGWDVPAAADDSRKRGFDGGASSEQPDMKKSVLSGFGILDPKALAQQAAANMLAKAGMGFEKMQETSIPNNLVGLVIGRGGEMINKLQSESGAKVQVAGDPGPGENAQERKITVSGNKEAVDKAIGLIEEIRRNRKIPERLMAGTKPGEFAIEMNIANGKIGLIIGKGGETIKSLQERSGCKMVLFQDGPYAQASEKPLRLSGEQSAVMYAKQLVSDLLTSKELEAATTSNYKEVKVPKECVGMIIGAKGANIQQIQADTGCKLQFKNEEGPQDNFKVASLTGTPQQLVEAEAKIMEIINNGAQRGGEPGRRTWNAPQANNNGRGGGPPNAYGGGAPGGGGGYGGGGGPGGGAPGGYGGGGGGRDNQLEMVMEVPANKCGMVIGRSGETIKQIHMESKAIIDVQRDADRSAPMRTIKLKGTQESINKAMEMIREKTGNPMLTARPAGPAGPGGPGGPGGPPPAWGGPPQQPQGWGAPQPPHQNTWGARPPPPQQPQYAGYPGTNTAYPGYANPYQQQPPRPAYPTHQTPQPPPPQPPQQQPPPPQEKPRKSRWDPSPDEGGSSKDASGRPPWEGQQATSQPQTTQYEYGYGQPAATTTPASTAATAAAGGQRDYSAEWAKYYEEQRRLAQQQPAAPAATPAPAATAGYGVGQYEGYQQYGQQQYAQSYAQQQQPQQAAYAQYPASAYGQPAAPAAQAPKKDVDDYQSKLQDFYKSISR